MGTKFLQEGNFIGFDTASGYTPALGDLVYVSGNNEVNKASSASGSTAYPAIGMVFEFETGAGIATVVTDGIIKDAVTGGWTYGDEIYVGSTAGSLTNTKPSAVGTIVQMIGVAKNATDLMLTIESTVSVN